MMLCKSFRDPLALMIAPVPGVIEDRDGERIGEGDTDGSKWRRALFVNFFRRVLKDSGSRPGWRLTSR